MIRKSWLWIFFPFFILVLSNPAFSQKKMKSSTDNDKFLNEIIANVGSENITYRDLEKAYKKNMNRSSIKLCQASKDSIMDFLTLYINFRLKVHDALQRGYDKDSSVIQDIASNRRVLAESYIYEKKLTDPNVAEILQMREREKLIAIILVQFPPIPNPDTLPAFQKATNLINMIKSGKSTFETLAIDSSDDKETSKLAGLVPAYFTAGNVQKNIEDAFYSLKTGEIYPSPILTRSGYLIIKLVKDEPRIKVRGSHILISPASEKDSVPLDQKADSILTLLKKGADFAKLAKENSSDQSSAQHGGDLGTFYSRSTGLEGSNRRLVPAFVDTLFAMKDGQISGKVHTEYGIHIIKRDSTKAYDPETEREEVKQLYKKMYLEQDKKKLMDSLRIAYGLKIEKNNFQEFASALDSNKTNLDSAWFERVPKSLNNKVLYTFNGKVKSVDDFVTLFRTKPELRGLGLNPEGLKRAINKLVDPVVFDEASKNLEKDYPEFAALMNDFRDGILLFKVEGLEVWDKLKFDSTLAKKYFDTTKTKYYTGNIYDLSEVYVLTDSLAKEIYEKAKAGENFEDLAEKYTIRQGYREKKGNYGKVTVKENKLAQAIDDKKPKSGAILEPFKFDKGFSIVKVNSFEASRLKTFEEAISDIAPEVQDILQKRLTNQWLDNIRKEFKVKIDEAKLNNIIKALNN